jgi:hypothetical protein
MGAFLAPFEHMSSTTPTEALEQAAAEAPARQPLSGLTPTSWTAGRELAVGEWVEQGRFLGAIGRGSAWWIGDWLRYGSSRYGDRYAAASQLTGYDVQSLMNMTYVASRFDSSRRRPGLSFSHHAELAGLAPEDQELWLDRAEAGALSVRALRTELRMARQRASARQALSRTRLEAEDDAKPTASDGAVVCPHCGHHFDR